MCKMLLKAATNRSMKSMGPLIQISWVILYRVLKLKTQGFSAHDQAEERTLVQSTPLETSLPATIIYATSTDLLALERKLEVLVAEATTTISSRLLTHIANPTTVSDETALTPEANSPEGGLPNLVASTSTGPRDPTVTPMKRRRGKTPAKVRVNKSPSSPPED